MKHDELLALKNAAVRVLSRNPETGKAARHFKRSLDKALDGTAGLKEVRRALSRQPKAIRRKIFGTQKDALREIQDYRQRTRRH